MVVRTLLGLLLLLAAPATAAEAPIVAEARAFMNAYARDLAAGDRTAITARYSGDGAYALGFAAKILQTPREIAALYAGPGWQKPVAFAWRDLSFEPAGPDAVVVTGGFEWTADAGKEPGLFAYTALLRREANGLRLRLEHENPVASARR